MEIQQPTLKRGDSEILVLAAKCNFLLLCVVAHSSMPFVFIQALTSPVKWIIQATQSSITFSALHPLLLSALLLLLLLLLLPLRVKLSAI